MAIVTLTTLKENLYFFKDDVNSRDEFAAIIDAKEKEYVNAALSPQLALEFWKDIDAERFQEIRKGWIDDDNCVHIGLDAGMNSWCAWWLVKNGSFSIMDGTVSTPTSGNVQRLNAPLVFGNETYNKASNAAYNVTLKVMEDEETFPEFTEGKDLDSFSFYL